MLKTELLYKITGTETPLFVSERENVIIDKCLEIINEKEEDHKLFVANLEKAKIKLATKLTEMLK